MTEPDYRDAMIDLLRENEALRRAGDAWQRWARHSAYCGMTTGECSCGFADVDAGWQEAKLANQVSDPGEG